MQHASFSQASCTTDQASDVPSQIYIFLSYIMLSPFCISTYMRPHVVFAVDNIFNPTNDSNTRLRSSLGIGTAHDYWHHIWTTSSDSYAYRLENVRVYTMQPSKCSQTLHLDSDSFDICIDTSASSKCTMTMEDSIPDTYR